MLPSGAEKVSYQAARKNCAARADQDDAFHGKYYTYNVVLRDNSFLFLTGFAMKRHFGGSQTEILAFLAALREKTYSIDFIPN